MDRFLFIFCIVLLFPFNAISQSLHCDEGNFHWEGGLNAGLNNDGYELDFRGSFFPIQYIGIKIGLGFAGEIEELGDWGKDESETGHEYAFRFKFNPAIVLRSPEIIHWKNQDGGFFLFTEPGVVLSPGSYGSHNAEYFRWDIKSGINFQIDRYIFTVGYGISNFSLYSGSPHNYWGTPDTTNYTTHTVYIGAAYKF